jgi:hypothetical protein
VTLQHRPAVAAPEKFINFINFINFANFKPFKPFTRRGRRAPCRGFPDCIRRPAPASTACTGWLQRAV